jgi:hypothetical protein
MEPLCGCSVSRTWRSGPLAGGALDGSGRWRAPWEARALFTSGGAVLSVIPPGGGAAGFEFPLDEGGNRLSSSSLNYRGRYRAELLGIPEEGGNPLELRLTRPDGSYLRFEYQSGYFSSSRFVSVSPKRGPEPVPHQAGGSGDQRLPRGRPRRAGPGHDRFRCARPFRPSRPN